jgi:hypothetical protein
MTLPEQLASKSGSIVEALKPTDYQHNEKIDVETGESMIATATALWALSWRLRQLPITIRF